MILFVAGWVTGISWFLELSLGLGGEGRWRAGGAVGRRGVR